MAVTQVPNSQLEPSFPPVPLLVLNKGRAPSQNDWEEKQGFGPGSLRSGIKSAGSQKYPLWICLCVAHESPSINLCSANENIDGGIDGWNNEMGGAL